MCAVSAMMDYGRNLPEDFWTKENYEAFRRIIQEAVKFDKDTGQPDCEDPKKAEFIQVVERKLNN